MAWTRELPSRRVKGCWRDHLGHERAKTFATKGEALKFARAIEPLERQVYHQANHVSRLIAEVDRLLRENEQIHKELLVTRDRLIKG